MGIAEGNINFLRDNPLGGTEVSHRKVYDDLRGAGFVTRGDVAKEFATKGQLADVDQRAADAEWALGTMPQAQQSATPAAPIATVPTPQGVQPLPNQPAGMPPADYQPLPNAVPGATPPVYMPLPQPVAPAAPAATAPAQPTPSAPPVSANALSVSASKGWIMGALLALAALAIVGIIVR
jgi:hypothetical protein